MALKLKPTVAEKQKQKQIEGGKNKVLLNSTEASTTREELANIAGVGQDTIRKVEKIEEKATPRTKQLLREGKLSN